MLLSKTHRAELDNQLIREIAFFETNRFVPTASALAQRFWPGWGPTLGLSGAQMLAQIKRQFQSLKIEGRVDDRVYGRGRNSNVQGWGLSDKELLRFRLFRPVVPPGQHRFPVPISQQSPPPPPGPSGGKPTGTSVPQRPLPEVPRDVFAAASLLGVNPLDSPDRINQVYRDWAKSLHPDRNPSAAEATRQLQRINAARDLLLRFADSRRGK